MKRIGRWLRRIRGVDRPPRHLWMGVLVLGPGMALARCDSVTFSSASLDVGVKGYRSLPDADVPGYKVMGTKTVTLRAICDDAPETRQVRLDAVAAGDAPGLVRWASAAAGAGDAGAARVIVQQATAGGQALGLTFTPHGGTTSAATPGPLTLPGPGVLGLDLRGVPGSGDARRSLLVNLQIQTLVKASGFAPTGATSFRLDMGMTVP